MRFCIAVIALAVACAPLHPRAPGVRAVQPLGQDIRVHLPPRVDAVALRIDRVLIDGLERLADTTGVERYRCLLGDWVLGNAWAPDSVFVTDAGEVALDSAWSGGVTPAASCADVHANAVGVWHSHVNRAFNLQDEDAGALSTGEARGLCQLSAGDRREHFRIQMLSVRRGVSCAFWAPSPHRPTSPPRFAGDYAEFRYDLVWASWREP